MNEQEPRQGNDWVEDVKHEVSGMARDGLGTLHQACADGAGSAQSKVWCCLREPADRRGRRRGSRCIRGSKSKL